MKLAFVHAMRTGGSYALSLLSAAGVPLVCPFIRGKDRDWNRQEIIQLAMSEAAGCLHSHQVAWDEEAAAWVKSCGWRTFTILRDPCEQITSLWHFCGCQGALDQFAIDLIDHRPTLGLTHHFWELPAWWREIDVLVPYRDDLRGELVKRLGIDAATPEPGRINGRERKASLSAKTAAIIERSAAYDRYATALIHAADVCSACEDDCAALAKLVEQSGAQTCLEVGSYLGRTAITMARAGAECVYAVDTWQGALLPDGWRDSEAWGDRVFRECGQTIFEATYPHHVIPVRDKSVDVAARWAQPLELIFIDGNHDYEHVRADIDAWWPHVKAGGILCGHDYCDYFAGVKKAVDESGPVELAGQAIWWRRKA